jgi:MFS family permease
VPQPRTLPPPADPQENLEWEERNRWWGIAGALVGAVLPLIGLFVSPKPRVPQDLPPGELTSQLIYYHKHASGLITSQVLIVLGTLGTGVALLYLYRATKGRRPRLQPAARVLAILGPVLLAIAGIVTQTYLATKSADFVKTAQTDAQADHILKGGLFVAAQFAGLAGVLALGFGFVMISLNAMRAGLLTRFMGVLGILVGVLPVLLSLLGGALGGALGGGPAPIVQFFWLGALAYLFSGRWPNGLPPAWQRGEEVPWPSSEELRKQREEQQAARGGGAAPQRPSGGLLGMLFSGGQQQRAAAEAEPVEAKAKPATRPSPATSARKRKRKKRR